MKNKKMDIWTYVSLGIAALLILFLVFPLVNLLREAVFIDGQFTLVQFQKFFSKPYYFMSIFNSTKVALAVTFFSLLIGIPFSYFYSFYNIRGKKLIFVLLLLSTMSAPYIGAYAWILLMGNSGLITNILKGVGINGFNIYGYWGIVFVQTLKLFPLVVIYMNGAFKNIDSSLLDAAESMGCVGVERVKEVILKLSIPTVSAAALLVFMRSFADFGTPILVGRGYSTFPVLIFNQYLGETGTNYHFAAAISVIAVVVTGLIFVLQKLISNQFKFTISAMNPITPKDFKGKGKILSTVFNFVLLITALLPQVYIAFMSFKNYNNSIMMPGYSLNNYRAAIERNLFRAIGNTLTVSIAALVIIVVIAVLIAYLVVRRSNLFNNSLDTISMLPYIMPGGVIGIALIISFSKAPFYLSGTLWIMIIALAIRRLPFTSRSATAAMMQVSESVEEAAISLGASKLASFIKITVPMMSSGIIAGAILSWVSIITEMSSGVILYNNRTITLTLGTYVAVNNGTHGIAAVFATVTGIITILCLIVYLQFAKTDDISI